MMLDWDATAFLVPDVLALHSQGLSRSSSYSEGIFFINSNFVGISHCILFGCSILYIHLIEVHVIFYSALHNLLLTN